MAQTILIKRSSSTATPTSLANGELAYSSDSNKLFVGRPGGGTGDIDAIGGKYYTDIIAGAASANTASKLVVRDGSGNFSAGTITASFTGALTGNADTATVLATARTIGGVSFNGSANIDLPGVNTAGNQNTSGLAGSATILATARTIGGTSFNGSADIAVALAATATKWATARTASITGDVTWTSGNFDGTANVTGASTLATVNSNVGSFGSTTAIPIVTVNAKGLVTAISTGAISTSFDLDADSGTTNAVAGGETLTIAGGTGVATSVSGNTVSVAIGQAVATNSNVTFNNVSVDGTLTSDDITATTLTASGNVIVSGNLTVNGTTTTVNSNTVAIGDAIMTLNSDETGTPSANAGLEVERGTSNNVSLVWNESANYWQTVSGETANVTSPILTAANFAATYTGNLDGGTF
jgi:hypothetical protein|tara:strand:+ start:683 stop:1921 length:1239 start_codon:yes stop_codon:yes gene_type:complete